MPGGGGPAGTPVNQVGCVRLAPSTLPAGCSGGRTLDPVRRCPLYMGYYLGEIFFDNCVNMNGAPRMRTPSRRSGARSCHAPGGMAARGPPVGVLRSAAHRRAESRFWGVFIIAVHRAFVLGLGARHRGIVELSEGVIRCVTVFACYSSSFIFNKGSRF